jgi:hypothetical protein
MTLTNFNDIFTNNLKDRFWAKVIKGPECWEWNGFKDKSGYSQYTHKGNESKTKNSKGHRVSYALTKGDFEKDLVINHICSNRGCVNPDHLEAITQKENMQKAGKKNKGTKIVTRNPYYIKTDNPEERFLNYITKDENTKCWLWRATKDPEGYGVFSDKSKGFRAHRWAYQNWVGELIKGMHVDHLCGNTSCVNPEHLEQVSERENQLRKFHSIEKVKEILNKDMQFGENSTNAS